MVKITYLGHASFKIESNDGSIIVDPYQDGFVPGLRFPRGQEANFVFCSHEHNDHNARDLVKETGGITLNYIEHMAPHDKNNGKTRGLSKYFIFYLDGLKIAHLGDMADFSNPKTVEYLKGMDVILCPINNFFTMGPDEAFELWKQVKPKLIIPMHYYFKDKKSGYEDGDQIERFHQFFPNNIKVNDTSIMVEDYLGKTDSVIFENYVQ